jgi:hypothetical protein
LSRGPINMRRGDPMAHDDDGMAKRKADI